MKPLRIISVVLAIIAALWALRSNIPGSATATGPAVSTEGQQTAPGSAAGDLVVRDVTVRDGREVWRGDVDLAPVLERVRAGGRDEHRNDGGIFANREGLLPAQRRGYYREYVIRTEGIDHAGPQRLIVGGGGELFYTSDHYASFRRVR